MLVIIPEVGKYESPAPPPPATSRLVRDPPVSTQLPHVHVSQHSNEFADRHKRVARFHDKIASGVEVW